MADTPNPNYRKRQAIAIATLIFMYGFGIVFVFVGGADTGAYLYGWAVGLATVLLTNWANGIKNAQGLLRGEDQ